MCGHFCVYAVLSRGGGMRLTVLERVEELVELADHFLRRLVVLVVLGIERHRLQRYLPRLLLQSL